MPTTSTSSTWSPRRRAPTRRPWMASRLTRRPTCSRPRWWPPARIASCRLRWCLGVAGSSTMTVNKETTTVAPGSKAALYGSVTVAAAGNAVVQKLEATGIAGRTITASMMVLVPNANMARLRIDNDVGGVGTPGAYHSGNSQYQALTVTAAIPANATAVYLIVELNQSAGFYLDNAMLVVGSTPADYQPLHPADDLARCLRYYEVAYGEIQGYAGAAG